MTSYSLSQLAEMTGAALEGDGAHLISGVENLEEASPLEASFLGNPRYASQMAASRAGVIFVKPDTKRSSGQNYLLHDTPSLAFQKVIEAFLPQPLSGFHGRHPSAVIHEEATLGEDVTVSPNAVIDRGVKIGKGTWIGPGVTIGPETTIGENCRLDANVTIRERCILGNRVTLQSGAVIGSCGYGYHTGPDGVHLPLKQLGRVVLEDDVEVGANTAIDRARYKETRIRCGTKIDNLVQIAHQVEIGKHNLIVSQAGIAGSSKTGNNVVIGGQAALIGHISIADRSILAARAAAIKSLNEVGAIYTGVPATPLKEYNQLMVHFKNLPKYVHRIKDLEKKLSHLTSNTPA